MRVLVFTNMYPWEEMPFYGSFVEDEVRSLRERGIDVDVYFVNGRKNRLQYLGMPAGFSKRLRRGYDVVHVHHSYCGFVATMQRRVPVVWTFHEGEILSDRQVARKEGTMKRLTYSPRFKRHVAARVDALIVVSDHLRDVVGRPDAVTLASGIDTQLFAPMETGKAKQLLGLDARRRYVLFPSSPARVEKRYDLARHAMDEVERDTTDVELICLDNVAHDQVPLYMNASELMLMTSAFEASPVTVREALCCNVPVVSTDVGDVRSVFDGIDGCAIARDRPEDIAAAVQRALAGPRRVVSRPRMERYSLDHTSKVISDLYAKLARDRSAR